MIKINLEPEDVWAYCESKPSLEFRPESLASNDEYGISIDVSLSDNGNPEVTVYADFVVVYNEVMVSEQDCEESVKKIYDKYLSSSVISAIEEQSGSNNYEKDARKDEIEEREIELFSAALEMLDVFTNGINDNLDADHTVDVCEDLVDCICEYLALKHGIYVRRPMWLSDSDGDFFEEFPYEHMDESEFCMMLKEKQR